MLSVWYYYHFLLVAQSDQNKTKSRTSMSIIYNKKQPLNNDLCRYINNYFGEGLTTEQFYEFEDMNSFSKL